MNCAMKVKKMGKINKIISFRFHMLKDAWRLGSAQPEIHAKPLVPTQRYSCKFAEQMVYFTRGYLAPMENNYITVLLVDDDAEYAKLVKHLLRPFQGKTFEIIREDDIEKAIDRLRSNGSISIILIADDSSSNSGLELVRRVVDEKTSLPIIFLTTNKDFRVAIEAMKSGADDYLVKEDSTDTVLPRTIINLIEGSQLKNRVKQAEQNKIISKRKTDAIQELIVTMCHEFNNPLAAIKISSDILARQPGTEEMKKLLEELNKNIHCLEEQITRLRDLNLDQPT